MAVQEQFAEPITFPQLISRSLRKASPPTRVGPLHDDPVYQETAAGLDDDLPVLSAGAFIDELNSLETSVDREEAMDALVSLSQAEVRGVIRLAAKAKARYLAALVDLSERAIKPDHAIANLQNLRQRREELAAGVTCLKTMILSGDIQVKGVGR